MEKIFLDTVTRPMVAGEHQNKFAKGETKLFKYNLANKSKDVILPLYLALSRSCLGYCVPVWAPQCEKAVTNWNESNGGLLTCLGV